MSLVEVTHERDRHEWSVIVASVLGVLLVIAGPGLAASLSVEVPTLPVPVVEEERLSPTALRVLDEVPGAFEADGIVVVPATTDPYVAWAGALGADQVRGPVVDLGVDGLVGYGSLPAVAAPDWLETVGPEDQVFSDVGTLSFACATTGGGADCEGTLVARHIGQMFVFRTGLGSPTEPLLMTQVDGFGSGGRTDLWLGWVPDGAVTAWATVVGHQSIREVPARTTPPGAVEGSTLWWVRTPDPVSAVSFRDARGEVVLRVSADG
ncbi:MAG TPA: hypothetical protein VFZ64_14785 [Nocardioidaceae bacterium]